MLPVFQDTVTSNSLKHSREDKQPSASLWGNIPYILNVLSLLRCFHVYPPGILTLHI